MKQSADMETKLQQLKPVLSNEFNASKIGYFGIMLSTCKIWPAHLPDNYKDILLIIDTERTKE